MKVIQDVVAIASMEEIKSHGGLSRLMYVVFGDRSAEILRLDDSTDTWMVASNMFLSIKVTPSQAIAWDDVITSKSAIDDKFVSVQIDLDRLVHTRFTDVRKDVLLHLRDIYTESENTSEPLTSNF